MISIVASKCWLLTKTAGKDSFHMCMSVHPLHVIRINKMPHGTLISLLFCIPDVWFEVRTRC